MKHKILMAAMLAASLALVGCGGGGGSSSDDTPDDPPSTTPDPDYAGMAKDYRIAAADAEDALDDAIDQAKMAVAAAAEKAGMLTATKVKGESKMAMANAQAILDAADSVDSAVMDAKTALTTAKATLAKAKDLPADTDGRSQAISDLEDAIKTLEMEITINADGTHKLVAGGALATNSTSVETHAATVKNQTGFTTGDKKGKGTPADTAKAVAMDVQDALDGTQTASEGIAGDGTTVVSATLPSDAANNTFSAPTGSPTEIAMGSNSVGKTFAQIFAGSLVTQPRGNANVETVSLTGAAADGDGAGDDAALADNTPTGQNANYTHMGIVGEALCRNADGCSVTEGKLGAGWYFVPLRASGPIDNTKTPYIGTTADGVTTYSEEVFAKYGVWMTADNVIALQVGRMGPAPQNVTLSETEVSTSENKLAATATYTGDAAGLSVHKTFDSDGNVDSLASGKFTADVELTATFGGTAINQGFGLVGKINNFQGDAVDTAWVVNLKDGDIAFDGGPIDTGATGGTNEGVWRAVAYTDKTSDTQITVRPTGYFGDFHAHFSDGHAAGVYIAD